MNIFRKQALESRFKKKELHLNVYEIKSKVLWLIILFIFIISLLIWCFFGNILLSIYAEGIVMPKNSKFYSLVNKEKQLIEKIHYSSGIFQKGQIIFELTSPELNNQLKGYKDSIKVLKRNHNDLIKYINRKQRKDNQFIVNKNKYIDNYIKALQDQEAFLRKKLIGEENLKTQGFISENNFFNTKEKLSKVIAEKDKLLSDLHETSYNSLTNEYDDYSKLKFLEYQIREVQNNIDLIQTKINEAKYIRAPKKGIITEIKRSEGEYLPTSLLLAEFLVSDSFNEYEVLCFVKNSDAKKIKIGNKVIIKLQNEIIKNFFYDKGEVIEVSRLPVSQDYMLRILGNNKLPDLVNNSYIPIRIKVNKNNLYIDSIGTTAEIRIIVLKSSPFKIVYNYF